MRKAACGFILMLVSLVPLMGCETEGQKREDLKAQEETRAAQQTLDQGHMAYNLGECYKHLGLGAVPDFDKLERSKVWSKFRHDHHIDDTMPSAMSDADLKDCLAIPTP